MPKFWVKASETIEYEIEIEADTWDQAHDEVIELIGQEPEKYESNCYGFQVDDWCEMIEEGVNEDE